MESAGIHGADELPGVSISGWESGGVQITEVRVENEAGARLIGKPEGHYITLECEGVRRRDPDARTAVGSLLGEEIARLLPDSADSPVLVVGLGNRMITPDALGPLTVDGTLVTRHLYRELPHLTDKRMSPVCAVAPGVMGVTGIETMEMVRSIVQEIRPRAVIAIDSLAARSTGRVGSTVQLTDTGIQPGSGVGNHRSALTEETLGVPVLALGVPMVVYAATIARDAFELLAGEDDSPEQDEALDQMAEELLAGSMGEMIVTPREVDALVEDAATMLACGINRALHPGLTDSDLLTLMD
jgi:spore protease